jgi:hypothetical protein
MVVVCYFTDPAAMQKVLPGLGGLPSGEGEGGAGGGAGRGVGAGEGEGSGSPVGSGRRADGAGPGGAER